MSARRPPRLPSAAYVGRGRFFLTIRASRSQRPFRQGPLLEDIVAQLLRTATEGGFEILAFCFMPDHVHLLVESVRQDSDLQRFVKVFKQQTGFRYRRETGQALWQEGYFDRVLRREEDARRVAAYIWGNPVRAGIVADFRDWPLSGSQVFRLRDWVGDETMERV